MRFAVAGHVYGNPDTYTLSIYPPFLEQLKKDDKSYTFDYLFLTGDVAAKPTDTNWMNVENELRQLSIPYFIAPGNHDGGDYFLEHIQKSPYCFFSENKNHFIVLNTTNNGWTTNQQQTDTLQKVLSTIRDSTDKIFVFTHQLWWLKDAPDSFALDSIRPNSYAAFDGKENFWENAFPYFDSTGCETWFFAGDVGSHHSLVAYYEDHYQHFHFYASGMGGGADDNYLHVALFEDGRIEITKVKF
ncbi:MAG: metallophosphoesterase [Crocinitomicaceae bacterium]|nr:metallophosphoesterase [Crocinitomicaceae bacterium]MBK8926427.1 metallophosphoesterase [Crocinitomicaceae bacterium]